MDSYERTLREHAIIGSTYQEIARKTGVSYTKVFNDMRKLGISNKRHHKLMREDKELIEELYQRISAKEIAVKFDVKVETLRTWMTRLGIRKHKKK